VIAIVALFCLLGGSAWYANTTLGKQFQAQALIRATQSARSDAFSYILDEETGMRGYAATRDRLFLEPFLRAQPLYPQRFEDLRRGLAALAIPGYERTLADMRGTYYAWLNGAADPLIHGAPAPATAVAMQRRGKVLIDAYRHDDADIRRRLDVLSTLNDATALRGIRTIFLLNILALPIVGGCLVYANNRQRRVERELSQRKRMLDIETISEVMPQIVWTAKPSGEFDWYNRAFYDFTDRTYAETSGDRWHSIVHPDDVATTVERWGASVASGEPFQMRNRLVGADGTYRWYDHHARPIRDDGGRIVKWFGTATDIHDTLVALENEKNVADMLQLAFIQKELPVSPNLGVRATYIPAQRASQVGGDWYDAFLLPDKRVFFSIGDVTGHGLDAAVSMSRARQFIIAASLQNDDPASVLANANRAALMQRLPIVTAIVGFIDPETREIRYATAGHPPPVLAPERGSARFLPYGGIPLGVLDRETGVVYTNHTAVADPGSILVLYTDGVIEHGRDVLAGETRLLEAAASVAAAHAENPASGIHDLIFRDGLGEDDVAILTFRFERSGTDGTATLGGLQSTGFGPTQTRFDVPANTGTAAATEPIELANGARSS